MRTTPSGLNRYPAHLWFLLFAAIWLLGGCNSAPEPTPAAVVVEPPAISDPKISAPTPQEPGQEIGIAIDVSSASGVSLTYEWRADGGEIVRGQGSPAITYRTPAEPGIYNVRVTVKWDTSSVEKVTTIRVEAPPGDAPTPEPPTDTPAPEPPTAAPPTATPAPTATLIPPTDTPAPTNTPRPTPIPTEVIDADPTLYDNFDNPAFDGDVDFELWRASVSAPGQIEQRNGYAKFSVAPGAGQTATLYPVKLERLQANRTNFIEARFLLNSDIKGQGGDISVSLIAQLDNGQTLIFSCLIYRQSSIEVGCEAYGRGDQAEYLSTRIPSDYDVWHSIRIEMTTDMQAIFFIDGQQVGSYKPDDVPPLKGKTLQPRLEVWSPDQDGIEAYFDDVRIGSPQSIQSESMSSGKPQVLFVRPSCGSEYTIEANRPVELYYGAWGAYSQELVEQNADNLTVSLLVDGQMVMGIRQPAVPMSEIPCGDVYDGFYWVLHKTVLDSLSPGEHTIEDNLVANTQINDGGNTYEAGESFPATFTVIAK